MGLTLLKTEPAVVGALVRTLAASALPSGCPACGPLAASVTSRYCERHLRQMRAAWLAGRSSDWRPAA
jgi:hypothetical protein